VIQPASNPLLRGNIFHLYADILLYGITSGTTLTFLVIYATRLGATGFQIAMLTAGPAIVQLVFSLPVGVWLERQNFIQVTYRSAFLQRLGYVLLVFLPWLLSDQLEIRAIILVTLIGSIPGTILMIGFNAILADLVPVDLRSQVIGRRNALLAVSLTVSTLVSGYLLDELVFPLNYQVVFTLGAAGAMLSTLQLTRLKKPVQAPQRVNQPLGEIASPGVAGNLPMAGRPAGLRFLSRSSGKALLRPDLLRSPFGVFMAAYMFFYFAQYLGIPVYPLFMVNELGLTDSQISLGFVLFYLTMFLGSLQIGWITRRWGERFGLVVGALLFSSYPFFFWLAQGPALYYLASFLGGAVYALVSSGLTNRLMIRVPDEQRPSGMAFHNLSMNSGTLLGSMVGPMMAEVTGLRPAMLLTTVIRLLAGLVLYRWG
jgi:MFS family permease